ncbi:SDR family NAD(P)-dependent oxidoreductase, partial [Streptomyces sp. HPF1205]|uniref:SDR family NAD(P)-dependent oxidoreductase n=1 Tax=Streptomyces sp. HPF1205 TaxID=2873262 RepID=UPI001CED4FEB
APGVGDLVAELEESGARVSVAACDVADREAVAGLLEWIDAQDIPLTAVVHAAGTAGYGPLDEIGADVFGTETSAKVCGAVHLDELLGERELAAFVVFSSISGVWGSGGQAAYSAGNAFVDALVEERRGRGLAGMSVAWGPWA